jgi:hypothetical protein
MRCIIVRNINANATSVGRKGRPMPKDIEDKFHNKKNLCADCLVNEVNVNCNRAVLIFYHPRKECDGCKRKTGVFCSDITNPLQVSLVLERWRDSTAEGLIPAG